MSLFERIREKRINLNEQTFSDRQKSDMRKLLNKNFGSKKKAKETAGEVIKNTAKKDVERYFAKSKSKSKGGGATTGGAKTVYQSDISKQAKKFTKKINKKNINRPEGVIGDTYVSTDKKGNIRSAKRVNPTLKKSVSQVKADIEFKQSLKKAGASGDVSDTAPKKISDYVKKVRDKRIKDLKLPDTSFDSKTKFSQKDFEKSIKKKFPKKPKTASQPIVTGGGPPVSNLPTSSFKKPPDPFKTSTTKTGSLVKGFKFQPRDVSAKTYAAKVDTGLKKAKKSFKKLSRDIQDYRDRDVPGGPKKTRVTRTRVSYRTTPGGRESVGMASKFVNKYKKGHPMNPEISGIDFDKPKTNLKTVSSVTGGGGGKKPPVKRKTGGTGGNKPRKPRKISKKLVSPGVAKVSAAPKATRKITKILGGSSNVDFYKSGSKLARGISKVSPGAGKLALGATKTLARLGTPGRIAATVGTVAALSPAARKGISGLAKQALAGAGLGGVIGGAAASQKMSDKERIKKNLPAKLEKDKSGKDIKTVTRMNLNLSDVNKKKKDKGRTPQSIATEVDYLKKRQKVAPYGAKYTG